MQLNSTYNPTKHKETTYTVQELTLLLHSCQGKYCFIRVTNWKADPSAFDRINVRRLFIVLEKQSLLLLNSNSLNSTMSLQQLNFRNIVEPFLREVQVEEDHRLFSSM